MVKYNEMLISLNKYNIVEIKNHTLNTQFS